MRILISGCGDLGLETGRRLARLGHQVWGLRRHPEPVRAAWQATGIQPLAADLTRPATLAGLPNAFEAVIHTVSASGGGPAAYQSAYLDTTTNLLEWLDRDPLRCLVYTSSTSVYSQQDGGWIDESSPAQPVTETGRVLVAAEELLLAAHRESGCPVTILRLAGLYGPGRSRLLDQFLAGEAELGPSAEHWLNLIHREDAAAALVAMVHSPRPGAVFNVADDEPSTRRQIFIWLAQQTGRDLPTGLAASPALTTTGRSRGTSHKRVSNRALREALGWRPLFPSFREGYAPLLAGTRGRPG